MAPKSLPAKSLVEAFLYFQVTPCPTCKSDRLDPGEPVVVEGQPEFSVVATCRNCSTSEAFRFTVPILPPGLERCDPISGTHAINLGSGHSELIDLVQWVTLYEILLERCSFSPDPAESRWLKIRAGQCLDEALKFIEDDRDLASAAATFADASRRAVAKHPERYTRSRLIGLRNQLPSEGAFGGVQSGDRTKRPWWKFW